MQREFLEKIVLLLEQLTDSYAITGSIASSYWGVARFTHDLDILVVMNTDQARALVAAFPEPYYASVEAAVEAVMAHSMFNILDCASNFKADLWISADDPFNESVLKRRRRVPLVKGLETYLGSPEDVLLHKLVWHTITPSERQLGDAAGIAQVQSGNLDLEYMRSWAVRQGTTELLEDVLQGKHLKNT